MKHDEKRELKIAIDGPAASGKSTTARLVAQSLGYLYIDTGAMYRAVTLAVLRANIDENNPSAVKEIAEKIQIRLEMTHSGFKTYLNNEDVSEKIREPKIGEIISTISSYAQVRDIMVKKQREIAARGGVVMDGRDIGTTVIPDADLKFFMEADVDIRAQRRFDELNIKGVETNLHDTKEEIRLRDHLDSTREVSPLIAAPDAYCINTSSLSIEEQVEAVLDIIRNYVKHRDSPN